MNFWTLTWSSDQVCDSKTRSETVDKSAPTLKLTGPSESRPAGTLIKFYFFLKNIFFILSVYFVNLFQSVV